MNHSNQRKRGICRSALLAAIAALVISGPASGEDPDFPIRGGLGGGFFITFCPANNFMVGLEGRAGDVIDNFILRCGSFQTVPSIAPRKDWRRNPDVFSSGNRIGESTGGAPVQGECSGHNFVRAIEFNTRFFDGIHLIAAIDISCDHGTLPTSDEFRYGFNLPIGTGPVRQICPDGQWATGLKGRSGERVDAIALLCARMPPF